MGRKATTVMRSRKNTNNLNKVETVKSLLVNSGIGGSNQGDHEWESSNAPQGISRVSSVETEEADFAVNEVDDTYLVTTDMYHFVVRQLLQSRVILIFLQWFFNWIIPDFPTDAFRGVEQKNITNRDAHVQVLFGGLSRWDSQHFLHVAEFGYTWESTLAFFPFFPMLLRISGSLMQSLISGINLNSAMIIGGVIMNNILFVFNGLLLFKLCIILTKSTKESLISVYVFCFNPASVFFSSLYTETIYLGFTLLALTVIYEHKGSSRLIVASCIFSFAYLTRANGILNIGYVGYPLLIEILVYRDSKNQRQIERFGGKLMEKILKQLPILLACALIIVLPLRIFGWSIEDRYCGTQSIKLDERLLPLIQSNSSAYVLPGNLEELNWCQPGYPYALLAPKYYTDVQNKYWNVGLFRYWRIKKIPMFLMALPTLSFVLYGIVDFLLDVGTERRNFADVLCDQRYLIPFLAHSSVVGLTGFFVYNVEVSMRMLYSSSPFLYIVIARIMNNQTPRIRVPEDLLVPTLMPFFANYIFVRPLHFWMMFYLLGYFFFGTLLHVNWLPFV